MKFIKGIAVLLLALFLAGCDATGVNDRASTVQDDASPPEVTYQLLDDVGFHNPDWYKQKSAQSLSDRPLAFASHRTVADTAKSSASYWYRSFSLSFDESLQSKSQERTTYSYFRKTDSGVIDRVFHGRIPADAQSIAAVHETVAPHVALDSTALEAGNFKVTQSSFPKCDRTYTEIIVVEGQVFETVVCESDSGGSGGGSTGGGSSGGGGGFLGGGDFGGGGAGGNWPSDGYNGGGAGGGSGTGEDGGSGTGGDVPCSLCVPTYPTEDIGTALLGSNEEVERVSDILVNDHAYEKHGQDPDEYPNRPTRSEFRAMTEDIIRNPDEVRIDTAPNNYGIAFWSHDDGSRGTIVIWRPGSDGGTVFSPGDGYDYFDSDRWKT
jgi:hypothetical protein